MIAVLVFGVAALGVTLGVVIGFTLGRTRSREALRLARYDDAVRLAADLVNTPDALDLRDRAQQILAHHNKAQEF
ncbi:MULTISPECIES: hypothetical protein [Actinoplanes]|uniref:hypothetical protein n=1 Tax=Actinoplanes TaxID=1865 RepID=UPI0005F2AFCF|nr:MULTISPECIES: hypothetical protein [Actinoplanes]